jgi:hypothetical protein
MSQPKDGGKPAAGRRPRASTRWPIEVPVLIHDGRSSTSGRLTFDTKDLSVGGAFLKALLLLEIDEVIGLELQLDERITVRAKAKVVRVSKVPPGMGIAFTKLEEKDKDALRRLVQQRGIQGQK